jgi:branched-chain amino acid transport system ATP-binding protein
MSPDGAPILSVANVVKRFGGFHALDGLSFHVVSGEILGLVGPNGSGKTTAINVISGLYAPDDGRVVLDGASIGGVASHKLVHRGINRTFQVPKPFLSLTVRQNIEVALAYGRAAGAPPAMAALLDEYRLAAVADRPAADLNNVQQKMLDLVRALATRPRLLLLDELAAGLNPSELDWIAERIKALAQSGMAIIVVEHLMGFIEHITDRGASAAGHRSFPRRRACRLKPLRCWRLPASTPATAPCRCYGVSISTFAPARPCCCSVPTVPARPRSSNRWSA